MVIVLDCNIWVTLAINKQIDFIANLSDNGVIIATCTTLRNEIADVLHRPRLSKFISGPTIDKVIELHDWVTTMYKPGKILNIVTDPNDNYLFALALKSNADFLVTGDKLLLKVVEYKKTKVVTLSFFQRDVL